MYYNHTEPSSYASVSVHAVRQACIKYVAIETENAKEVREGMIADEMKGWFGTKTREKAITRLDKDKWNWSWNYYQEGSVEYKLKNRVKGLLALCELSTNGCVSLTEQDARLVSTYKDKQ